MADIITITKAKATALSLEKMFGVEPSLDIQKDYVRVYYPLSKLKQVQDNFKFMLESKPGAVRVEWMPFVSPVLIRKYWYYPAGAIAIAFLVGRLTKR